MTQTHTSQTRLTRRGVLVLGGLGVAGVAGLGWGAAQLIDDGPRGTVTPETRESPVEVTRDVLERRTLVGPAQFVYEVDGRSSAYYATAPFGQRLDAWAAEHTQLTGQGFDQVRSYGAWVSGNRLWHSAGRAFDIAGLNSGSKVLASCRYDVWRDESPESVAVRQRAYWRLAATLHLHFADVLTYLYDVNHANHIHVDTGRFGQTGTPRFIPRSSVQTQAVQGMLTHVWGVDGIETSGTYDGATRDAAVQVLADVGFDGELADGTEAWGAFMRATARHA